MADTDRLAEIKERLKFTNGYSYAQLREDAEWMAVKLDEEPQTTPAMLKAGERAYEEWLYEKIKPLNEPRSITLARQIYSAMTGLTRS